MPEFRFRRKKKKQQSSRRHTVHDAEEAQAQVAAARKMVSQEQKASAAANVRTRSPSIGDPSDIPEPVPMATMAEGGHLVSTGTLARERERFFDLLRTKYPEHGKGIEDLLCGEDTGLEKRSQRHSRSQSVDIETMHRSSEEEGEGEGEEEGEGGRERERGRRERRVAERGGGGRRKDSFSSSDAKEVSSEPETIHHRYGGCFFLRQGEELRRCPIPSPVTLSTLKNLLVNTFDLRTSLLSDPTSYVMIQDRGSIRWKRLTDVSDIYDHCIIQLADPDAPCTNPTHFVTETMLEDHTYSSSESPPCFTSNHPLPPPPPAHYHCNHSSHVATPLHSPQAVAHKDMCEGPSIDRSLWESDRAAAEPPLIPSLTHHPAPPHAPSTSTSTVVQYGSPQSVTSSTSGVCSESLQMSTSPLTISRHVRVMQRRVQELREDYESLRKEQRSEMADFSLCLRGTSYRIMAAIRGHSRIAALGQGVSVEPFHRERLELTEEKVAYRKHGDEALLEVSILESAVEDIRRDVVERRCRVHEREVDGLVDAVQNTIQALSQARDQYHPLESKMKRVMEKELTNIVQEEKFIQGEFPRLEEAGEKCRRLTGTLETLKQVAIIQFHRTPLVPYFAPVTNPDRVALLENIRAVMPNHAHRVESLEMAKCVQHKKKELVMRREGIRRFESQLRRQREHLHKMESTLQLEDRQAKKMIQLYLDEKAEREAELAREIKLERKVAERKRKEEREKVKERLQRQREDEGKKTRVKQLRSQGEQGSHSVAGEEGGGEWYSGGDGEDDSINFSSSFSSTASLLEHVRSMNGWSSDNASLHEKTTTTAKEQGMGKVQDAATAAESHRQDKGSTVQHQASAHDFVTVEDTAEATAEASVAERGESHTQQVPKPPPRDSGIDSKDREPQQASSSKSLKLPKRKKFQPETTRLLQSNAATNGLKLKQQKAQSLPKDSQPRNKHESSQPKTAAATTQQLRMNNEARGVQSPTTGLQSIFKANQTRSSLPQKHTNQPSNRKTNAHVKQSAAKPVAKLQRHRVPLNDVTAPPIPRRVASSEALLDDPRQQQNHNGPTHRPISTATQLVDTPPKIRKSIGYMGEFDSQAGIYDLLEKKPQPNKKRQARRDSRLDKGFQTPTFEPRLRPGNDVESQEPTVVSATSNSQPDNFDFISNPSYETRSEAQQKTKDTAETEASTFSGRSAPASKQSGPPAGNTGSIHHSYVTSSRMPKPVAINSGAPHHHHPPKVQQPLAGSSRWQNSESDSSDTGRVRSVLSDLSSTRHSNVSGRQSNSSGAFSGHSEAPPTSHKLHSHVTSRPHTMQQPCPPLGGEDSRTHSGLPAPRKRYHSHPRGENESHSGHRHVVPHPPPHRGETTRVPIQTVHDEGALTSYPRFQRREDHQARLQAAGQPGRRQHRTKQQQQQLGVLPGTGQLAQVPKPLPDHTHLLHPPTKSSRHSDTAAGSLV